MRITAIQRYLRHEGGDSWSGEKSFLYGRSVVNQRIEAWLDNCEEELLIGGLLFFFNFFQFSILFVSNTILSQS